MKNPNSHPNRPQGFTLVELLVVIAIIIVLAVLSFSVVTRIRKTTDQAVVTSNMRQLSMAMLTTVADKGRFPWKNPVAGTDKKRWEPWILPAMGFDEEVPSGVRDPVRPSQYPALATIAKTFAAPDDKVPRLDKDAFKVSFCITPWVYNNNYRPFDGDRKQPEVPPMMTQIVRPERAAMIVQRYTSKTIMGDHVPTHQAVSDDAKVDAALKRSQIVAFADGHVEKITVGVPYTTDEFRAKYEPITNGDK
jgi:prepilin-type N-terminal cleavage/methylation domain-containing protein